MTILRLSIPFAALSIVLNGLLIPLCIKQLRETSELVKHLFKIDKKNRMKQFIIVALISSMIFIIIDVSMLYSGNGKLHLIWLFVCTLFLASTFRTTYLFAKIKRLKKRVTL